MKSPSLTSLHRKISSEVITTLPKEEMEFPVYWGHYSSWLVIVKDNLQRFKHENLSNWEHTDILWPDINSEDLKWTILCLDLINEVKNRMQGEIS